jgi:hypothetical protein
MSKAMDWGAMNALINDVAHEAGLDELPPRSPPQQQQQQQQKEDTWTVPDDAPSSPSPISRPLAVNEQQQKSQQQQQEQQPQEQQPQAKAGGLKRRAADWLGRSRPSASSSDNKRPAPSGSGARPGIRAVANTAAGPAAAPSPRKMAALARPVVVSQWWSMDEGEWAGASDARKKIMSHVGRIQETVSGMDAAAPCDWCEGHELVCRVYTPVARKGFFSDNEGYGCGHCRKLNQPCSHQQEHQLAPKRRKTVASLEAIISKKDLVIERENRHLASRDAEIASLRTQLEEQEFEGFGDD